MLSHSTHMHTWRTAVILLMTVALVGCAPAEASKTGSATTTTGSANTTNTNAVTSQVETAPTTDATNAVPVVEEESEEERPAGWTTESHSNDVDPNYAVVFPQGKVNEITFIVEPEAWEAMQANMVELYGEPGIRGGPSGDQPGDFAPPNGFEPPADGERPQGFAPPANGERPEGFAPPADGERPEGRGGLGSRENPMWITATVEFEGNTWTNVGLRYKGNSSLSSGWNSGSLKLPFKLDFDEFEDAYPEIDNQRFFGFKQLSLANGFNDSSFMRDAVTYDLLEEAGLVAAETAFYEVYIDYGEGLVDLGLYTMIEVIDDTVVERYFGDDDGNIYEGDGAGVSLAEGTLDQIESSFEKENNEDEADWSDIEALYNVLHADLRATDPAAWRAELESVFDVDTFLHWLALSAVIGHWDTYGSMSHNFYLYDDPATGQLTWISWDHNMTMSGGGPGGGVPGEGGPMIENGAPPARENTEDTGNAPNNDDRMPPGGREGRGPGRSTSLDKADVGENWPLIRYLLDDPTYYAEYVAYVESAGTELFAPDKMTVEFQTLADLIRPYAATEIGETEFDAAVQQLIDFANTRAEAVTTFLRAQQ